MTINTKCQNGHINKIEILPPCKSPIKFCKICHTKFTLNINFAAPTKIIEEKKEG